MRAGTIVLIVSIVLICITALVLFIRFKVTKQRNKRKVAAACAGPGASASIFVELLSDADADETAATLASLFEKATCSLRVYAGVYELYDAGQPTVADAYASAAARTTAAFCLKDHVRCLRVPARESKGVLSAMEQLRRFLYRGETYIMSVRPGTRFVTGWDTLAIECLADAERRARGSAVALTTLPASDSASPTPNSLGTYVAIQPTSGAMLAHRIRAKPTSARTTPAIVWSSAFSFAKGAALTGSTSYPKLPDDAPVGMDALVHDYFITLQLLHAGWQLAHPLVSLATTGLNRRAAVGHGSADWRARVSALNRPYLSALAVRGIAPDAQHRVAISARAAMGLTPDADPDEIVAKLGSIGEYLSVLTRLELDTNALFD